MRLVIGAAMFAALAFQLPGQASAAAADQTAKDEEALSVCIKMHTTGADRILTARWMFAAMAKAPQISDLVSFSNEQKSGLDRSFAQLLTRILVDDCLTEVRPLAAKDTEAAFGLAGKVLGGIAMQELFGSEEAEKSLTAYVDFLSEDDFKPLKDSLDKAR